MSSLKSILLDYQRSNGKSTDEQVQYLLQDGGLQDFQEEGTFMLGDEQKTYSFDSQKNDSGDISKRFIVGDLEIVSDKKAGDNYMLYGKPIFRKDAENYFDEIMKSTNKEDKERLNQFFGAITDPVAMGRIEYHPKYKGEIPEYNIEDRIFYQSFPVEDSNKKQNKELLIRDVPEKRKDK